MMFLVLGPKAPLTAWCQWVVSALCQTSFGAVRDIRAETAQDLLRELLTSSEPGVVTLSRPDVIVTDAVVASGRPFLLAAPAPRSSVEFLVRETGASHLDAVRHVLADLSTLAALARAEGRLVIEAESVSKDAPATIGRIAAHLGLTCTRGEAAALSSAAAPLLFGRPDDPEFGTRPTWTSEENLIIEGAVNGFRHVLTTGRFDSIVAARHFFRIGGGGEIPLNAIDATGRGRLLIYGPFLSLPPGDWTARCVFSFSSGMIGIPMSVDVIHFVGGFHEMARTSFTVTSAGRLDVNVRFVHAEPAASLEIRLFSDRAVFDGTISLGYVEFNRNTAAADSPEKFIDLVEFGH